MTEFSNADYIARVERGKKRQTFIDGVLEENRQLKEKLAQYEGRGYGIQGREGKIAARAHLSTYPLDKWF